MCTRSRLRHSSQVSCPAVSSWLRFSQHRSQTSAHMSKWTRQCRCFGLKPCLRGFSAEHSLTLLCQFVLATAPFFCSNEYLHSICTDIRLCIWLRAPSCWLADRFPVSSSRDAQFCPSDILKGGYCGDAPSVRPPDLHW